MSIATQVSVSPSSTGAVDELDVLVVGASFGGFYHLDRLRELGFKVKVYEAGERSGGIWYWNRYPGARVDTPGFLYQFSREDLWSDWDYDELYPSWKQVRAYFDHVDRKLDLSRDVRYNTRVVSAEFDEADQRWIVDTENGRRARARFVVMCTGIGAKVHYPDIPGLSDFKGQLHHTGEWPEDGVDLSGKRVGVIGTGATGVQVIQEVAKVAKHLTVFQRTPNIALPMGQRQLDDAGKIEVKNQARERYATRSGTFAGFDFDFAGPSAKEFEFYRPGGLRNLFEELWEAGGFKLWLGTFFDILTEESSNQYMYDFWREKVHGRVRDPKVAEMLAPKVAPHPFGARRPSLEQDYFEVFNQSNVELVDVGSAPIERVTERGVLTSDGSEYELDVLILATGFDTVTGSMSQIDIRCTDGELLRDKWNRDGVDAFLGAFINGLPNMAMINGPLSPNAFWIGPAAVEQQGREIVHLLEHMREQDLTRFESTKEADREWRDHADTLGNATVIPRATGWYMGTNVAGKPRQILAYVGGAPQFLQNYQALRASGYEKLALT